jgi:hypothetical protein
MEKHGKMTSTGETPDYSTKGLWKSYHQSHLVANHEELAKDMPYEVPLSYFDVLNTPSHLSTWGRRLYFPPKEGVLRIAITLSRI